MEATADKQSTFDWAIYADGTLAGLSVLIPIPLIDSAMENYFRKRMIRTIAKRRKQAITKKEIRIINHQRGDLLGCLLLPFTATFGLLIRIPLKILYFWTVKKSIDALSRYWQRAYLLDYIVRAGHLNDDRLLPASASALNETLDNNKQSPLTQLARQIVSSPSHIWRSVRRARQGVEDEQIVEAQETMAAQWNQFDDYFGRLQSQYDAAYAAELTTLNRHHPDPEVLERIRLVQSQQKLEEESE